MAVRTSTQSGNTHSSPFAFGTTVNDGDQLQVTNAAHAINFDQSCSIGFSPCMTQQTKPTAAITGTTGNLPAGGYRARIAAVGSTGITTASAPTGTLTVTGTPGVNASFPRITLPTLPAGATSWNVYLTNTGTATGTERLYATGKSAGTFDCTSASWMDGSDTYTNATALPFGNAFGYTTSLTSHTGGVTIAAGVTVTAKGNVNILGEIKLNAGSILEADPTSSPSGLASYSIPGFGTVDAAGTAKLTMRGSSGSRATIRGKSGTTPARITTTPGFAVGGPVRLDCEWFRFSNLGTTGVPAINCDCNATFDQLLTDGIFDADCRELALNSLTATGGWNFTRVAFRQTSGNTYGGRTCAVAFNPVANKSTATRLCTNVSFEVLPVALCQGGALWDECYFNNTWANSSAGGAITTFSEIKNCFVRKVQADATNGIDSPTTSSTTTDNYLYHDWITGGGTDFNPWGLETLARGVGTTVEHSGWVSEYNGEDGGADFIFPDNTPSGTIRYKNNLVLLNASGNISSGNICTLNGISNTALKIEILHNTYVGENAGCAVSEGGLSPAGIIAKLQSNLVYNFPGTDALSSERFMLGISAQTGNNDTLDSADPANVSHNAAWNLKDITGLWTGAYRWYNTRFSVAPAGNDVDLGNDPGADLSTNGPKFVDPTRRFITWATAVLSASGTDSQKITTGLNALKAIADTTSSDHVVGLEMTDPRTWVWDGFVPRAESLRDAGHDGVTIGAIEMAEPAGPAKTVFAYHLAMQGMA